LVLRKNEDRRASIGGTLELLDRNPGSLSGRLDRAIKWLFYGRWIRTRDFTWESIDDWNVVRRWWTGRIRQG